MLIRPMAYVWISKLFGFKVGIVSIDQEKSCKTMKLFDFSDVK